MYASILGPESVLAQRAAALTVDYASTDCGSGGALSEAMRNLLSLLWLFDMQC
jgi:hypothetical protein